MIEAVVLTAAEEMELLKEWFETVHFDEESEGIPTLNPERDDEESRSIVDGEAITDWFRGSPIEPVPVSAMSNDTAWTYVDWSIVGMAPSVARGYMEGEARFQELIPNPKGLGNISYEPRINTVHSKKNGQFAKKSGAGIGTDQSKWAENVSRDMENSPLSYGDINDVSPRPLQAIAHKQGFDALPEKGSVNDAITAGGLEIHRGIIPHAKSGTSAETIQDKMVNGQYEPGKGGYGNGYYFSTSPGIAKMYSNAPIMDHGYNAKAVHGGVTVRAALHKDAKVIDYDQIEGKYKEWYTARKDKIHWNAFETDFKVPEGKVSPSLPSEIRDPGHFAALMGYDAIRVPLKDRPTDRRNKARIKKKIGSDDLGDEIVVLNRGALVVDA